MFSVRKGREVRLVAMLFAMMRCRSLQSKRSLVVLVLFFQNGDMLHPTTLSLCVTCSFLTSSGNIWESKCMEKDVGQLRKKKDEITGDAWKHSPVRKE